MIERILPSYTENPSFYPDKIRRSNRFPTHSPATLGVRRNITATCRYLKPMRTGFQRKSPIKNVALRHMATVDHLSTHYPQQEPLALANIDASDLRTPSITIADSLHTNLYQHKKSLQ